MPKFKNGDVVYHRSDTNREHPLVWQDGKAVPAPSPARDEPVNFQVGATNSMLPAPRQTDTATNPPPRDFGMYSAGPRRQNLRPAMGDVRLSERLSETTPPPQGREMGVGDALNILRFRQGTPSQFEEAPGRPAESLPSYISRSPLIAPAVQAAGQGVDLLRYGAGGVRRMGEDAMGVAREGAESVRQFGENVVDAARPVVRAASEGVSQMGRDIASQVVPPPKLLTWDEAQWYLRNANGDFARARAEAEEDGFAWPAEGSPEQ